MQSYLTDRQQCVKMSDKNGKVFYSSHCDVERGVPQGSLLGPFLFILYINNLPNVVDRPVFLYADDTSVICHEDEDLQEDITTTFTKLHEWFCANDLKMNITKTEIVEYTIAKKHDRLSLTWEGVIVTSSEFVKFLGIAIDENLNWKHQINAISSKLSSSAYLLREIRKKSSEETAIMAYYGTTYSLLRYGIVFWGDSTEVCRAFKLQKRCIRSIFELNRRDSCKSYFRKSCILTLPSIYIMECVMLIKTHPSFFHYMKSEHQYDTRHKEMLKAPMTRFTRLQKNVVNQCTKIFNHLPEDMKVLPTALLKKKMKQCLCEHAFYSVEEYFQNSFD